MGEVKQKLDKFNGKNYPLWKFKLKSVMMGAKLWEVVIEQPPFNPGAKADEVAAYREKQNQAMSILTGGLTDTELT